MKLQPQPADLLLVRRSLRSRGRRRARAAGPARRGQLTQTRGRIAIASTRASGPYSASSASAARATRRAVVHSLELLEEEADLGGVDKKRPQRAAPHQVLVAGCRGDRGVAARGCSGRSGRGGGGLGQELAQRAETALALVGRERAGRRRLALQRKQLLARLAQLRLKLAD